MSVSYKRTAKSLVANVLRLTSLPSVYTQLEKTLKNPDHTRNDIAEIISVDPALTARLLRIINSSYYSLPRPVDNIGIAVNLLGEYDLRNLVLVSSVVNSVAALTDRGIDIHAFWQHSIRCGITAKLLAVLTDHENPELLFVGGLLHDIGRLIIYKNEPELSSTVSWYVASQGRERYLVEQELLGFDHATVGALLIESWGLPVDLIDTIKDHHQPERGAENQCGAKLAHLANLLVHYLEFNEASTKIKLKDWPSIKTRLDEYGIKEEVVQHLLNDVIEKSRAVEEIICGA